MDNKPIDSEQAEEDLEDFFNEVDHDLKELNMDDEELRQLNKDSKKDSKVVSTNDTKASP